MDLSIIVPAYNEMHNIENTLNCLTDLQQKMHNCNIEIIAIDDGSKDLTGEILKNRHSIKVLTNETNKGKGYSVKRGILSAQGNIVAVFDADMAYKADYIEKAYPLTREYDVIFGKRLKAGEYPVSRYLPSKMFHLITKYYLNLDDIDTQCGFKMFKRELFLDIKNHITLNDFSYDMQLVYYLKQKNIKYLNMNVTVDKHDASSVNLIKDGIKMLSDIKKIKGDDIIAH